MFKGARTTTAAMIVGLWTMAGPAQADTVVLEWNQLALAASVTASQGPNPQTRTMAVVHVAIHDAINSITGEYETYLSLGRSPVGASPEAAAIAAAHRALVTLFPSQAGGPTGLDTQFASSLAAHGLSTTDPGVAWGDAIGAAMVALRAADGAAQAQFPYAAPGAGDKGVWVAIGAAAPVLPGWGKVTTWVLRSASQFQPDEPPALDSRRYARDYNEVKDFGALNSTARSSDQTEIARFWLATPSAIWNTVARQVIDGRGLDLSSSARAFALMYLSAADAGIACWSAKFSYNFWRPFTAIRNGEADDNDQTVGDPGWSPLFTTPQHPEYPSGHSTNSGAMAAALTLLFGDDPGVSFVSTSPTNPLFVRHWTRFSDGVDEVIDARIYSGFHYRNTDEIGAKLGKKVARFVINHALREKRGHGHDKD